LTFEEYRAERDEARGSMSAGSHSRGSVTDGTVMVVEDGVACQSDAGLQVAAPVLPSAVALLKRSDADARAVEVDRCVAVTRPYDVYLHPPEGRAN